MASCGRHQFETAQGQCRTCGGLFCEDCLVHALGPKQPPFCIPCAVVAGGIRRAPKMSRKQKRQGFGALFSAA
jgi:hypothetical protein